MLPSNLSPVYEKDGFLFFKNKKTVDLIIDVSRIGVISAYMKQNHISRIAINSIYYPVNDLSFLKYLPFVQSISIVDSNHDISIINELKELREIRVGSYKGYLDFDNFNHLEILNIAWTNKLKNLENSFNLTRLWLDNYKSDSLEEFKHFNKLFYLYLYRPLITTLKGIGNMSSLEDLNIDSASKLESIDALDGELHHLETIYIYAAKQLKNYDAISSISTLKHLELRKTGETNSINFLKNLTNLEKVVIGFKVLDGNMNFLDGIKDVGFIDFPHYSRKMRDFSKTT